MMLLLAASVASLPGCRSAAVRAEREAARAEQLAGAKAFPAAAAALRRAAALEPDDPDLWLKLGRMQIQANDPAGAAQAFQRVAELAPDNVEALENMVVLSVRAGQIDRAKRFIDPLLVLQPDDPAGLLAQGAIALRERRGADALATADRLIAIAPAIGEAFILRARALVALGRTADAIALLRKRAVGAPEGPDAIEVRALLVDLYRQTGDLAGIRATALELHGLQPADPSYALESARALHARGQDARADVTLAALMRAHPGSIAIAQAIMDYRRATLAAMPARDAVAALAQGASRPIQLAVANALTDMGAPDRALALAAPLGGEGIGSGTVDADIARARALAALGRVGAAQAGLDTALGFDPTNVAALLARARLRLSQRNMAGALADAQLAQSSDTTSEAAALLVAQVHAASGARVLAQQAYANAVQAFPDRYEVLADYLDWLDRTGQARAGLTPIASFARQHRRAVPAWRRYVALCRAAGDPCLAEADAGLRAAG